MKLYVFAKEKKMTFVHPYGFIDKNAQGNKIEMKVEASMTIIKQMHSVPEVN